VHTVLDGFRLQKVSRPIQNSSSQESFHGGESLAWPLLSAGAVSAAWDSFSENWIDTIASISKYLMATDHPD